MIDLGFLARQRIAILGLGKSGLATARALAAAGAQPYAWDDAPAARDAAAQAGIAVAELARLDLSRFDALVLSPGVPRGRPAPHPAVLAALTANCPIVNDLDLLAMAQPQARFIGITGTNGKSTTTALIGHILHSAGRPAEVGGNLGTPALALRPLGDDDWYVLEASSYQLETTSLVPWHIGVFLNLSADHLDRYAGMDDYAAAKARLFQARPAGSTAVIGVDDPWSQALAARLAAVDPSHHATVRISAATEVPGGVFVRDGVLFDGLEGPPRMVADLSPVVSLPGAHNWQNAAAAYAAARAAGIGAEACAAALLSFPGLAHRQQAVDERDGIRFVNDSKATNPDAAAKALSSYGRIYWIAGGRPKQGGLEALAPYLDRVAHAYLIGEASDLFAAFLDGTVSYTRCAALPEAVAAAHRRARRDGAAGAVVLLSPACASFDQFTDFEARGEAFIAAVRAIVDHPEDAAEGAA